MKEHFKQKKWLHKLKTILALGLLLFATSAMAQLNGTYTIDSSTVTSGTNYQSFVDFADTINKYGVSGQKEMTFTDGLSEMVVMMILRIQPIPMMRL
ncbi:MAG: hypothetical protein ISP74_02740 [Bacteroidia bacterium]|nr:hypothetical protein [Bacteroidia bacterium]